LCALSLEGLHESVSSAHGAIVAKRLRRARTPAFSPEAAAEAKP
jgi:hypothetical protein